MQLVDRLRRRDSLKDLLRLRRGGALGHQPKPLGHPVDVGIDGEVRLVEREQQHARGGLRANTR